MAGSGIKNSQWNGGTYIKRSGYRLILMRDHPRANHMGYVLEHILIAEKALGKPLPEDAVIHHMDGNGLNNSPENLVICQDQAFHRRLHARAKAYNACGHADWLWCYVCREYDSPDNLCVRESKLGWITGMHATCNAERQRISRAKKKEKNASPDPEANH